MRTYGEVEILHRSEMRDPPGCLQSRPTRSVYPHGWLVPLPANHCHGCHRLHFMCLVYSSLSAPNTFLCVSSLFYLQIPLCHHKKVRRHSISHLLIPIRFSEGWRVCVCCPVCVFVWCSEFLLMRWKTFHGVVDVDLKLSHLVFLLQNNLFDYKVNHLHPLTPRLNYPARPQW